MEKGDLTARIRPAQANDAASLAQLYGWHVLHGVGTFEETPPTPQDIAARLAAVQTLGLPYYVAEAHGAIVALAYASPFRLRSAYRYTIEDSVYVAPTHQRQGLGRTMLSAVITDCEALGLRQMIAVIGDSGNAGSMGVHTALGFSHIGVMTGVGFKAGRWLDAVIMQRALSAGAGAEPEGGGLALGG